MTLKPNFMIKTLKNKTVNLFSKFTESIICIIIYFIQSSDYSTIKCNSISSYFEMIFLTVVTVKINGLIIELIGNPITVVQMTKSRG